MEQLIDEGHSLGEIQTILHSQKPYYQQLQKEDEERKKQEYQEAMKNFTE